MRVAQETGLAVVPLDGFSNRTNVTPFKILVDELLEGSVRASSSWTANLPKRRCVSEVVAEFEKIGIGCHVWARKEIESYLLVPSLLARVSGHRHRGRVHDR